jgi:hypothetical protein
MKVLLEFGTESVVSLLSRSDDCGGIERSIKEGGSD